MDRIGLINKLNKVTRPGVDKVIERKEPENIKVLKEKVLRDFQRTYEEKNGYRLSSSDTSMLRMSLSRLFVKYTRVEVSTAISSFFRDSYAETADFPPQLFVKYFDRYLRDTKNRARRYLPNKKWMDDYWKNPLGGLYEEITYRDDYNEDERQIRVRMETGNYGTIEDLSLEDIERFISRQIYNHGYECVAKSWKDAYYNRLDIYENPDTLLREEEHARDVNKAKAELRNSIHAHKVAFKHLTYLGVGYMGSKKDKWTYVKKHLYFLDKESMRKITSAKTEKDLERFVDQIEKKIYELEQIFAKTYCV
jgi:hypothetical protein